jgi:hypothetical protein
LSAANQREGLLPSKNNTFYKLYLGKNPYKVIRWAGKSIANYGSCLNNIVYSAKELLQSKNNVFYSIFYKDRMSSSVHDYEPVRRNA